MLFVVAGTRSSDGGSSHSGASSGSGSRSPGVTTRSADDLVGQPSDACGRRSLLESLNDARYRLASQYSTPGRLQNQRPSGQLPSTQRAPFYSFASRHPTPEQQTRQQSPRKLEFPTQLQAASEQRTPQRHVSVQLTHGIQYQHPRRTHSIPSPQYLTPHTTPPRKASPRNYGAYDTQITRPLTPSRIHHVTGIAQDPRSAFVAVEQCNGTPYRSGEAFALVRCNNTTADNNNEEKHTDNETPVIYPYNGRQFDNTHQNFNIGEYNADSRMTKSEYSVYGPKKGFINSNQSLLNQEHVTVNSNSSQNLRNPNSHSTPQKNNINRAHSSPSGFSLEENINDSPLSTDHERRPYTYFSHTPLADNSDIRTFKHSHSAPQRTDDMRKQNNVNTYETQNRAHFSHVTSNHAHMVQKTPNNARNLQQNSAVIHTIQNPVQNKQYQAQDMPNNVHEPIHNNGFSGNSPHHTPKLLNHAQLAVNHAYADKHFASRRAYDEALDSQHFQENVTSARYLDNGDLIPATIHNVNGKNAYTDNNVNKSNRTQNGNNVANANYTQDCQQLYNLTYATHSEHSSDKNYGLPLKLPAHENPVDVSFYDNHHNPGINTRSPPRNWVEEGFKGYDMSRCDRLKSSDRDIMKSSGSSDLYPRPVHYRKHVVARNPYQAFGDKEEPISCTLGLYAPICQSKEATPPCRVSAVLRRHHSEKERKIPVSHRYSLQVPGISAFDDCDKEKPPVRDEEMKSPSFDRRTPNSHLSAVHPVPREAGVRTVAQGTLIPCDQFVLALDLHKACSNYRMVRNI